jgi:hypothetical protein
MSKKTRFPPAVFGCLLPLASIVCVQAGEVKLISDTWDSVCRVEITSGPEAPNGAPIENFSDVPRNWSLTRSGRLCYRRASTPDNCESGMTQWNTRWKCVTRSEPGVEELSLQ